MDPLDSSQTVRFTYSNDKYSCVQEFYYIHLTFSYTILFSGIACMITRVTPKYKWLHKWFGKVYVIAMLLATASSLLVHNEGLPLGVLYSFFWVLIGLCVGYIAIAFHQEWLNSKAVSNVSEKLVKSEASAQNLSDELVKEKTAILEARTTMQRVFSYKSLHGFAMFISWFGTFGNVMGRGLPKGDFVCFTEPVYKKIDTFHFAGADKPTTPVPIHDPKYPRLPWANIEPIWAAGLFLVPFLIALATNVSYSFFQVRSRRKTSDNSIE